MTISSNLIGNSNDETNLVYKLILTDTQVSKIHKAFANSLSANIEFSKVHLSNIVQSGGFLFDAKDMFGSPPIKEIKLLANWIVNSYKKELKNVDSKEINK